jgi:hypothetical protein
MQFMSKAPTSISELISRWETIGKYADDVGCGYEAARQQRRRESIAPEHWANVIAASERKGIPGVTMEWLASQRVAA